jgi:hypothetical protein
MPDGNSRIEIMNNSFCPPDTFNDDFKEFLLQRSTLLTSFAQGLIKKSQDRDQKM